MYKLFLKRCIDFLVSLIVLIVVLPIFIFLIMGLFIANQGNPFFYQKRPGKRGEIFSIIKFKTMNDKRDINGVLLPDVERITVIGSFIRKYSLDEIPQLINVLLGSMSLIGPRPLLVEYLPLYSAEQSRRHDVKPGITGWAQVNGRNAISWEQKFKLDVWYVDNYKFILDMKIIFLTLYKVIKSEDINESSQTTTQKFTGN